MNLFSTVCFDAHIMSLFILTRWEILPFFKLFPKFQDWLQQKFKVTLGKGAGTQVDHHEQRPSFCSTL
jgi:hypothetical protein